PPTPKKPQINTPKENPAPRTSGFTSKGKKGPRAHQKTGLSTYHPHQQKSKSVDKPKQKNPRGPCLDIGRKKPKKNISKSNYPFFFPFFYFLFRSPSVFPFIGAVKQINSGRTQKNSFFYFF
uniref:hypothetical protein n=1 Tax=Acinetobacter baumannii TaxID=470 RepID=UPI001BB469F0